MYGDYKTMSTGTYCHRTVTDTKFYDTILLTFRPLLKIAEVMCHTYEQI